MGGLGNQLFQIFTTISYAIKIKQPFHFLDSKELGSGTTIKRYTFWDTFFLNLKPFLIKDLPKNMEIIKENNFNYNELFIHNLLKKDILIYGYFQSYKYFQDNFNIICKLIGLAKMKENLLLKLNSLSILYNINSLNTISIHFRLGDFKKIQDYHPILTYEYYFNSLNVIQNIYPNTNFVVYYFCEDEDILDVLKITIQLQLEFKNLNFIRGEKNLSDWEQMLFMSCCNNNIIANSSFSWWGAYFNNSINKIVCYPSVWFGPACKNDTSDLCPPEWICI
jgi:hypothetical protein